MKAYSMDLRERVLNECAAGLGTKAVAGKYSVSASWVRRLKQRKREHGRIGPGSSRNTRVPRLDARSDEIRGADRGHPGPDTGGGTQGGAGGDGRPVHTVGGRRQVRAPVGLLVGPGHDPRVRDGGPCERLLGTRAAGTPARKRHHETSFAEVSGRAPDRVGNCARNCFGPVSPVRCRAGRERERLAGGGPR